MSEQIEKILTFTSVSDIDPNKGTKLKEGETNGKKWKCVIAYFSNPEYPNAEYPVKFRTFESLTKDLISGTTYKVIYEEVPIPGKEYSGKQLKKILPFNETAPTNSNTQIPPGNENQNQEKQQQSVGISSIKFDENELGLYLQEYLSKAKIINFSGYVGAFLMTKYPEMVDQFKVIWDKEKSKALAQSEDAIPEDTVLDGQ